MWLRIVCLAVLMVVDAPGFAQTDVVSEWRKQMVIRLTSASRYPVPALVRQSGTVKVGFVIDRTGKLVSSWLEESTGAPSLDQAALATLERAQPFPTPPPELDDEYFRMTVPFVFPAPPAAYRDFVREEAAVNAKMRSICRGC